MCELAEEHGINFGEIETRFALHALLQLRRDALLHRGIHVNGHEVVADVILAHSNGGKPDRFAFVDGLPRNQCIKFGLVWENVEVLLVRPKEFLESGENRSKIFGLLCYRRLLRGRRCKFLGHPAHPKTTIRSAQV